MLLTENLRQCQNSFLRHNFNHLNGTDFPNQVQCSISLWRVFYGCASSHPLSATIFFIITNIFFSDLNILCSEVKETSRMDLT